MGRPRAMLAGEGGLESRSQAFEVLIAERTSIEKDSTRLGIISCNPLNTLRAHKIAVKCVIMIADVMIDPHMAMVRTDLSLHRTDIIFVIP